MDNRKTRPRIKLATTPTQVSLSLIAWAGLFACWLLVAAYYRALPAIIPTHFGMNGTPDGWGSKGSLIAIPVVCSVMYTMFTIITRFPHTFNYPVRITPENAERQYGNALTLMYWMRTMVIALFLYLQWIIVEVARHKAPGASVYLLPMVILALVIPTVFYLVRAYKNK